ncbi:MAG TPA: hypothetical protein VGK14_14385 [Novimethylophilus sp.]|jgi:hypothetical protein|uniref:hypothetical protein n=1 Tax=Novimethylophilus sp. TaxID=2137426 RepID=UPI002F3E86D6
MKLTKYPFALALLALLQALPAQAHYLWIEPVDGAAHLCFGEYQEGLREKAGGRLDSIAMPEAQTNDGKRAAVAVQRKADHFAMQAAAGAPLIAQEITMKVKDLRKNNIGIVKPMYYTRFAAADAEGTSPLALDIQPLGKGRVRVSLHGKPLAKAKLTAFAPNQWLREYETDASGEAAVETPWPGLYVLEVAYVELDKGEYQGDAYEGIRHVGTLSFVH